MTNLLRWLREGARTALFLSPRWRGLRTNAWLIAALVLLVLAEAVLMQRLYVVGPAYFNWQAVASGWLAFALYPWYCHAVLGGAPRNLSQTAPGTAALLTMLLAQLCCAGLLVGGWFAAFIHGEAYWRRELNENYAWLAWSVPVLYMLYVQWALLWRGGNRARWAMNAVIILSVTVTVLNFTIRQPDFWYAEQSPEERKAYLQLTPELMERQPALLRKQLHALLPQRSGHVDMYALTFAPYGDDVFRRESDMVAQVMSSRFDASGRTLQLVNHAQTVEQLPWATGLNLKRAILAMPGKMDVKEDVLFIHLTSHGARDGQLASNFWPLQLEDVTPQQLRAWLDEAGIVNRVISVSACYSGSWISPLAGPSTLVMTAADADHTSYGCGYKSELTFFGRAMYDEQLRNRTRDFELAHRASREVILKREQEAGKDDGYSNPQISVGPAIRPKLATFNTRSGQ